MSTLTVIVIIAVAISAVIGVGGARSTCKSKEAGDAAMIDLDPYDQGRSAGYHDELPDCPFSEGSEEAEEWWEGYEAGSDDC